MLAPLYRRATSLLKYFKHLKLIHVPREFNRDADILAKNKLREFIAVKKETEQAIEELPVVMEAYNVIMEDELAN